jgi:hypothetical protein
MTDPKFKGYVLDDDIDVDVDDIGHGDDQEDE